jgi:glycosyltransferase involved in cell wall biosynthesis
MTRDSVSVVIPAYNMDWCVARAVISCQAQTMAVSEIIIVDDCSIDDTQAVVRDLMSRDPRIMYCRPQENGGHLAALNLGARIATSAWIALLDADDELTPNSIKARIGAANSYEKETGEKPQLVYGDHEKTKFAVLKGYVFPYLCKELCLCQTSTIMLGQECVSLLPVTGSWWNTDDEIVLAIGKHFHVLHSGAVVAIYNNHDSPTRMSGDASRIFKSVCQLVYNHRAEIVSEQGIIRLLLWWVRLLRAFINCQVAIATARIGTGTRANLTREVEVCLLRLYRKSLMIIKFPLNAFLQRHFDNDFF